MTIPYRLSSLPKSCLVQEDQTSVLRTHLRRTGKIPFQPIVDFARFKDRLRDHGGMHANELASLRIGLLGLSQEPLFDTRGLICLSLLSNHISNANIPMWKVRVCVDIDSLSAENLGICKVDNLWIGC